MEPRVQEEGVRPVPLPFSDTAPRQLAVDSLQWAVGLFCAFMGAFVLVAPHQFANPAFAGLRPFLPWWGLVALVAGSALLSVPVTRPRAALTAVLHAAAGATLLLLAASFARIDAWLGVIAYSTLGLGTVLCGLLPPARRPVVQPGGDALALLMGIVGTLAGTVLLLFRAHLDSRLYATSWDLLPYLGAFWLATSPLLVWVQLRPSGRTLRRLVHLTGGAAFVLFGFVVSVPDRIWTGVALYCGFGLAVALLPWLRRLLAGADPSALRTRLALALALATSVALILAVAVVADQEERLAAEQVRDLQRIEAGSVAQNIADYLQYNSARSEAVAAAVALRPSADQDDFLRDARGLHPDLAAFATLDLEGRMTARAGDLYLGPDAARGLVSSVQRAGKPVLVLVPAEVGIRLLLLGTPMPGQDGRLHGVLVTAVRSGSLAVRISRKGSRVVIADGHGHTVITLDRTDPVRGGPSLAVLPAGWDRLVAAGRTPLVESRLAAFARVPGPDWAVAVERPREYALAGVRRGRELAFVLLLAVVLVAVFAGIVTARRIARPLGTLADAVDQMTAGNPAAPLGTSSVSEVARLSRAFAVMRDRLAARTAEAERLASESQARAGELAETDRRKDEFLAMLAHELRNPLGAIANASYLLEHVGPEDPREPRAERAMGVIQRQIQHLVRMVDDLLDVSRITRGKVALRREPLDLVDVVRQTVEGVRPVAEEKRHSLVLSLSSERLPVVADATRLDQVFSNLIRNAVKFTEPGGRIAVVAAREGEEAVVKVRDDGAGIAPELLPRVFDLFTQGEQALDRAGAGLGIGLTMVRRLVELHGGRVGARSEGPGRGAEFTVRLPLARAEVMAAAARG